MEWVRDTATRVNFVGPPDPKRLTEFLLRTGMHPEVLVHQARRKLRIREDGHMVWFRPKKDISRTNALIDMAPNDAIVGWYGDLISSVPQPVCKPVAIAATKKVRGQWVRRVDKEGSPITKLHCNCASDVHRRVAAVGKAALHQDGFGPRTCRHTFAAQLYAETRSIFAVMQMTGCSQNVAVNYARTTDVARWNEVIRRMK